jgi:hypothetical protein
MQLMRDVILPGFKLFLRNPVIGGIVFLGIVIVYIFFAAAILSVIPPEKILSVAQNTTQQEKMVEEFTNLLMEDIQRTIFVFVLFGSVIFVIIEFITAGVIGASMDINTEGSFKLSTFMDYGFLYTLRIIALEVLISMVLISVIMPISAIQFMAGGSYAVEFLQSLAVFTACVLTVPSRFVLVAENCGVFDALIMGMRFAVKNMLNVSAILIITTFLMFPAVILPVFGTVIASIAFSLSAIWYMRLYLIQKSSQLAISSQI